MWRNTNTFSITNIRPYSNVTTKTSKLTKQSKFSTSFHASFRMQVKPNLMHTDATSLKILGNVWSLNRIWPLMWYLKQRDKYLPEKYPFSWDLYYTFSSPGRTSRSSRCCPGSISSSSHSERAPRCTNLLHGSSSSTKTQHHQHKHHLQKGSVDSLATPCVPRRRSVPSGKCQGK